jgi:hypothetical protein
VGNFPVLIVFAFMTIGYACYCAVGAYERRSKGYPINACVAAAAILVTGARIFYREPLTILLLTLIICDIVSFQLSNVGRKDHDDY